MKLAITGLGGISVAMARAASMNERVQVAACCDVVEATAQAFADSFGIDRAYADYDAMLGEADLDAVYLAVPHFLHHPMTLAALERGLHVFCEKPVAMNTAEAREMAAAARAKGLKLGINYQYRYDDDALALVAAAREGLLGEIYYARCHVPYHREQVYYDGWHALLDQAGGGTMLTVGSHMLDLAIWACASRPASAVGMTAKARFQDIEVEDLAMGVVRLESGALIEICSSMVSTPEKHPSIELYGALDTGHFPPLGADRAGAMAVTMSRSLEGFRAWVEEGVPYRTPVDEATHALAAVEMIYTSARTTPSSF